MEIAGGPAPGFSPLQDYGGGRDDLGVDTLESRRRTLTFVCERIEIAGDDHDATDSGPLRAASSKFRGISCL